MYKLIPFWAGLIRKISSHVLAIITLLSFNLAIVPGTGAATDNIVLPELGDASSATISPQKERQLGQAWLRSFRGQVKTDPDPLLYDYLEDLVYRLVSHSELMDRRIELVVVENNTLNAFAVPGGVVGIHNGLLLHAQNEGQLASVLGHEIAHLSQRHFARSVAEAQKRQIPTLAGMLAGLILAATSGGDAGMAVMTATQAASLQNQLRYSRLHEKEADRVGMQTLVDTGYNPYDMAGMFEEMQRSYRFAGRRPPEFLLTHPITERRVADAANRAAGYPPRQSPDDLKFRLMRTRVHLSYIKSPSEAVQQYKFKFQEDASPENHYGYSLALNTASQPEEARRILAPLLESNPGSIPYLLADAEIDNTYGHYEIAARKIKARLKFSPNNHPLTMAYAQTLLKAGNAVQAEEVLVEHVKHYPTNPDVWYLLAETHGLAGNIVGVHQARAEYFILNGILDQARRQLGYALNLAHGNYHTTARIKHRIAEIMEMQKKISI
jgi:predicted Zn-dependent protease